MSEIYNAGDIVGKTLIATKTVYIYRNPSEGSEIIGTVKAGQPVGVVYAWLAPSAALGRSVLWWSFFPQSGQYFYTPHIEGAFDVVALNQQGVISTTEKTEKEKQEAEKANRTWYENVLRTALPWLAGIVIISAAVPGIVKGVFKK